MVQDKEGRYFFLYHAYNKEGSVYTGRQGLISEVVWNEETGWPEFKDDSVDYKKPEASEIPEISDDFNSSELSSYWQWPVGKKPSFSLESGSLHLAALEKNIGAVLAQRIVSSDFETTVQVKIPTDDLEVGLSAIGDLNNALGVSITNQKIFIWKVKDSSKEIISSESIKDTGAKVELKISTDGGNQYSFAWRTDGGDWQQINNYSETVLGDYLPPWDRSVRVGLIVKGASDLKAEQI